jgi:multiple sugar transport system ATP-binding protein
MPRISFHSVSKSFGDTRVIHDFNAEVGDNEFLVLLGPSGCGKSTMLRMVAGLTEITSGEIRFDDVRVNELEPRERNIAFVFQSYALYPHMTVRQNIAFPLVMDRFKRIYHIPIVNSIARRVIARSPEVVERVEQVARMLELDPFLERRPGTLSGGQRQRVAVGRALVRDPSVYLLDEPLSNLDAKLRAQMRTEIAALFKKVDKTFIYVTHDQVEAMTMATRIILLHEGRIQQIGTPEEIYNKPANTFVARFIGSPPMNQIPVAVRDGEVVFLDVEGLPEVQVEGLEAGEYLLGIRPERMQLADQAEGGIPCEVTWVEFLGAETIVGFQLGHREHDTSRITSPDTESSYLAKLDGTVRLAPGATMHVTFDPDAATWFHRDGGDVAQHARLQDSVPA